MSHSPSTRETLGFVGAGRLGSGLAVAAAAAGYPVVAVASRGGASAEALARRLSEARACPPAEVVSRAGVVFLAVPDGTIADLCATLPWRAGQIAVHASAVDGPELLEPATQAGAQAGTFHPLQAFGDPDQAPGLLRGATAAVDGDAVALAFLEGFAAALGCHAIRVPPEGRVLYHVAAVVASNHLVTLLDAAAAVWERAGLPGQAAVPALAPLSRSALEAVEALGAPQGLTGPAVRGDTETVRRHLDALRRRAPELLAVYRHLTEATISLAQRSGRLSPEQAEALRRVVQSDPA